MSKRFRVGDYLVQDDLTGQIFFASETVKDYKGNIVGRKNYLKRNPQDFVKAINDGKPVNPLRDRVANSELLLYPDVIGATSVPTPIGPASHLFNQGIGDMEIGSTFIVR